MNANNITSLADIFTPRIDRTLNAPFTGNHHGYAVTFFRQGDKLTVNHYGCQGNDPVRPLIASEFHSIEGVLSGLIAFCQDNGMDWECAEDIPQGFSFADPRKLADLRK